MSSEAEPGKPPMPDQLRPLAVEAIRRNDRRPYAPVVVSAPDRGHMDHLTCPYRDEDEALWFALLLECFGTRMHMVGQAFLRQLSALAPQVLYVGEDERRPDEESLRQALAIVYGLKPRNEAEAAHAAQMVAVHFATMKLGALIAERSCLDPRTAATLAALAKTYSGQLETMERLKGRKRTTRQTYKVERHVHIHQHDERHVHLPGEGGRILGSGADGPEELRARARPAGEPPILPALRSEDTAGNVLRLPCDEGPEALPVARRGQG